MLWRGDFRARGYYKLDDEGLIYELHFRRESRAEPAGYYLYGPDGSDVVAEYMGKTLAAAQAKAVQFVSKRGAELVADKSTADDLDATWNRLVETA